MRPGALLHHGQHHEQSSEALLQYGRELEPEQRGQRLGKRGQREQVCPGTLLQLGGRGFWSYQSSSGTTASSWAFPRPFVGREQGGQVHPGALLRPGALS